MILSRYLTKEVLGTLFGVTFILLLIFLSQQLVRYLSYAASGKIAANVLLQLIGFEIPYLLALLLPLGLFLGIILAYGRMYADSEMRIMQASGLSMTRLLLITSKVVVVVAFVVLLLMVWINPLIAAKREQVFTAGVSGNNVLDTLMPGRFQVSNNGRRVIYVEKISRDRLKAKNLFVAEQHPHKTEEGSDWVVLSADEGYQANLDDQEIFLVATNGYRYEGVPGESAYKIIQFKKYSVRLPEIAPSKHQQLESISTKKLWQEYRKPDHAAELQWRLAIPISVLLLALLAIPFSQIRPRQGKYVNLLPALLIYILYVNLLFVARNWMEQKMLPVTLGMWWVHIALLFTIGLIVLIKSDQPINQLIKRIL